MKRFKKIILTLIVAAITITLIMLCSNKPLYTSVNFDMEIDTSYHGFRHIFGDDSVIINWQIDSITTTYKNLISENVSIPYGTFLLSIYPKETPLYSGSTLFYYHSEYPITFNSDVKSLYIEPTTDYDLVFMDIDPRIWGNDFSWQNEEYKYFYTRNDSIHLDFYTGIQGQDSIHHEYHKKVIGAKMHYIHIIWFTKVYLQIGLHQLYQQIETQIYGN